VAKLVVVHGFSDHVGRYYGLFPSLAGRGVAVYGYDQRGWGRSVRQPRDKGRTGPTEQVIAELASFIREQLAAAPQHAPLFVLGHSMGGGEVLTLMADASYTDSVLTKVRGWLLEAPFIGWPAGEEPSALKIFLGRLAARILPNRALVHAIPPENLSRDPEVVASLRADPLCHDTGTLEGLASLLDRTEALLRGRAVPAPCIRSLWFGHGSADLGTSYPASKAFFERLEGVEDATFKTYEGWYHQLHAEPGRDEFYKDVGDWIVARSGEANAKGAAPPAAAPAAAPAREDGAAEAADGETPGTAEQSGQDGKEAENRADSKL